VGAQISASEARRLLYRIGAASFKDKVMLQWASAPQSAAGAWRMLLEMADNWQRPRFVLTGRDVMQAGIPQGPDVGRLLAEVEDWWVEGDFAASESALRDRLKMAVDQARA
jgi:poly(A) polymerase